MGWSSGNGSEQGEQDMLWVGWESKGKKSIKDNAKKKNAQVFIVSN